MKFRSYILLVFLRIFAILLILIALTFGIYKSNSLIGLISLLVLIYLIADLNKFIKRRFKVMDDFFEAVKYRDFSRWFPEDRGPKDIRFLHKGFNELNRTMKAVNTESEAQVAYIQKILAIVDVGIIAYNIESGKVLWANEKFTETIGFPMFKNISFVEKRNPELHSIIFETYYRTPNTLSIQVLEEKLKVLISETIFQIKEESFKLIVLQNIEETLDKNESEAWKKLLSVMTHEIMNSITPITSLTESLAHQLKQNIEDSNEHPLVVKDLHDGVSTIKKRSEGLLKFANTYRSLSKVTPLNLQKIKVTELFNNIKLLMEPSLNAKGVNINFETQSKHMELEIDTHLIEQVLINLILNARDALQDRSNPSIKLRAEYGSEHNILIKVYDNGMGIPKDIMENIFIPFFTSKSTGSGIGLSLCKQIMLQHKGKILVKSKENEGTLFSLVF